MWMFFKSLIAQKKYRLSHNIMILMQTCLHSWDFSAASTVSVEWFWYATLKVLSVLRVDGCSFGVWTASHSMSKHLICFIALCNLLCCIIFFMFSCFMNNELCHMFIEMWFLNSKMLWLRNILPDFGVLYSVEHKN